MPFTNRSHQTKQISQPKTAIKSPLPSTGHEEAFCDLHNHHLHRPRNRPCRALITRRRSATCTFTIFTDRAIAPTEHWSSGDVLQRAQLSTLPTAQSPLPSTGHQEMFCNVHNHHLHRPRNRPCRALEIRKRAAMLSRSQNTQAFMRGR